MKRIWMSQQKKFEYIPLKMGLGLADPNAIWGWDNGLTLCPKIYTTRTHRLHGEYYVVEGSRYKAKPVVPRIEFKVDNQITMELNLLTELIHYDGAWASGEIHSSALSSSLDKGRYTFPELDLGIKGATYEMLRDELLKLNPKADLGTPFYVHRLKSIT